MPALHRLAFALCLALVALPSSGQSPPAAPGQFQPATLRVDGHSRSYGLYVPAGLPPGRPLVVMLHGTGSHGLRMRAVSLERMDRLADQEGFAVAYPDAMFGTWNDCRRSTNAMLKHLGVDDVAFLRAVIADAAARAGVDPAKVFLFGFSGGGHMAFRMAWEAEKDIAAIAAVSASLPSEDSLACTPRGSTRVMLIKGTADELNPYDGGRHAAGGTVLSAPDTALAFAKLGAAAGPSPERVVHEGSGDERTTVSMRSWQRGTVPAVTFLTVRNGGHNYPLPQHAYPPEAGVASRFDSLRAAWQFFNAR